MSCSTSSMERRRARAVVVMGVVPDRGESLHVPRNNSRNPRRKDRERPRRARPSVACSPRRREPGPLRRLTTLWDSIAEPPQISPGCGVAPSAEISRSNHLTLRFFPGRHVTARDSHSRARSSTARSEKRSDARAITTMPARRVLYELRAGQDAPGRLALAITTSVRHQGGAYASPQASSSRGSGLGFLWDHDHQQRNRGPDRPAADRR